MIMVKRVEIKVRFFEHLPRVQNRKAPLDRINEKGCLNDSAIQYIDY